MSSLAASRADNFYFPPEWRPEYGGISKFQGSKGANQYQTHGIIRFELPFDGWCLKCERHMSKGLRFNAKKDKDGKYFSTTIFRFTMKCYSCDHQLVIRTDPENDTYAFVEGIRKMEQDFEPEFDDSIVKGVTDEERNLLASDPMFRLQHEHEDKLKSLTAKERLETLIELKDANGRKDYDLNSALRSRNREKRKRDASLAEEGKLRGLPIPLLEEVEGDRSIARSIKFRPKAGDKFSISERSKMVALANQPIFNSNMLTSIGAAGKSASRASAFSTEVIKHRRLQVATAKQATLCLDATKLKLKDSGRASAAAEPLVLRRKITTSINHSAALNTNSIKNSSGGKTVKDDALNILSCSYGDIEDDY